MMKNSPHGTDSISVPATTPKKCLIRPVGFDCTMPETLNPHPIAPPATLTANPATVGNPDFRFGGNEGGASNVRARSTEPEHCPRPVPANRFSFAHSPDEMRKAYPEQKDEPSDYDRFPTGFCDSAMFF